jgi:hypothetical protein
MTPEHRRLLTNLISDWYQTIVECKPDAADAARNLAALAAAHPVEYPKYAYHALVNAGLIPTNEPRPEADQSADADTLGRDEWFRRYFRYLRQNLPSLSDAQLAQIATVNSYENLAYDFPRNPEGAAEEEIESQITQPERISASA